MDPRPGRPPPQWGVAPPAAYQPLPIEDYAGAILKHIAQHRVTFIQGETGCGKSSMVPQFMAGPPLGDWWFPCPSVWGGVCDGSEASLG